MVPITLVDPYNPIAARWGRYVFVLFAYDPIFILTILIIIYNLIAVLITLFPSYNHNNE